MEETGVFNLAYGSNTTHAQLLSEIEQITGTKMIYAADAPTICFTEIDTTKLGNLIQFKPVNSILQSLPSIIEAFRSEL